MHKSLALLREMGLFRCHCCESFLKAYARTFTGLYLLLMKKQTNMISQVLDELVKRKAVSVQELCDATGRSESTIYRWLSGDTRPDFDDVFDMIRKLASTDARKELVLLLAQDLPVSIQWLEDAGSLSDDAPKKPLLDVADLALLPNESMVQLLKRHHEALRDGKVDEGPRKRMIALAEACSSYSLNIAKLLAEQGDAE